MWGLFQYVFDLPLVYEANEGYLAYNSVSKDFSGMLRFLTECDKVFSAIRKYRIIKCLGVCNLST